MESALGAAAVIEVTPNNGTPNEAPVEDDSVIEVPVTPKPPPPLIDIADSPAPPAAAASIEAQPEVLKEARLMARRFELMSRRFKLMSQGHADPWKNYREARNDSSLADLSGGEEPPDDEPSRLRSADEPSRLRSADEPPPPGGIGADDSVVEVAVDRPPPPTIIDLVDSAANARSRPPPPAENHTLVTESPDICNWKPVAQSSPI